MAELPSKKIQDWNERIFPNFEEVPEKIKNTPIYCKKVCEAAYYYYVSDKTDIGYGLNTFFDLLRLFGKGKQPVERYKSYYSNNSANASAGMGGGSGIALTGIDIGGGDTKEFHRKGWMNINWDIISPLPNLKTMLQGHFVNTDYDIKADAIDVDSGAEQETRMYRYLAKVNFNKFLHQHLGSKVGLMPENIDYIPENINELEQLKAEGGFKTPYSLELEKLLLHTENISYWDRSLKKKYLNDLIDLAVAFAYAEYNYETCKVEWKYADPKDVIIQYSRYNDFRDVDWGGIIETIPVSELKSLCNLLVNTETNKTADINDLAKLAFTYRGYSGNPSEVEWENFSDEIFEGTNKFDRFKVPVMKLWWKDVEYDKKIEYTTKKGKKRYYDHDGTVKKLSDREKLKVTRKRKTYQCYWIPGTNWVYNYGAMPNQPREPVYKPLLPLVGVKLEEKSITHRSIPIADIFQIAWNKLQNSIATAAEDGYAINISLLANVGESNGKLDWMKVIQMWREKGILFYKNPPLGMNTGGTAIPINKIDGGLEQTFTKYLVIMDSCIRQLEILTGFSPVALGATPTPSQQVGTTEMALTATNKALTVLMDSVMVLKENLAAISAPMIQLAIKNDSKSRREYTEVIGEEGVDLLKMAKSIGVRYGIRLTPRPTQEEWMELINLARSSFQRRSPEVGGLNEGQYMWVIQQKNSGGNLKEVAFKINSWIKQSEKQIQQNKERLIQLNNQGQQQTAQLVGEQTRKNEQTKLQSEIQKINNQLNADRVLEKDKHIYKMKERGVDIQQDSFTNMMAQKQPV